MEASDRKDTSSLLRFEGPMVRSPELVSNDEVLSIMTQIVNVELLSLSQDKESLPSALFDLRRFTLRKEDPACLSLGRASGV